MTTPEQDVEQSIDQIAPRAANFVVRTRRSPPGPVVTTGAVLPDPPDPEPPVPEPDPPVPVIRRPPDACPRTVRSRLPRMVGGGRASTPEVNGGSPAGVEEVRPEE